MTQSTKRLYTKDHIERILKEYTYKVERKSAHSYKAIVYEGPDEGSIVVELMEK